MDAISIKGLSKTYRNSKCALDKLNLTVKVGEIFALLGTNGAGKSTLINILTTCLQPTSGEVLILGKNLQKNQSFVRTQIACVAQQVSIDDHLSLCENMLFQGRLYGIDKQTVKSRMETLITSFGLVEYTKHKVATYSGGIKRRLDIAMSMMSCPQILFLDEPTVGMDIESRQSMWEIVKKIQDDFGATVFLTTHYLEEADVLSDTICIMKDGHELVQNTPENLRKYTKQNIIKLTLCNSEDISSLATIINQLPFVQNVRVKEEIIYVKIRDSNTDFLNLNRFVMDKKVPFDSIEVVKPSLDDIFLKVTHSDERSI